MTTVYIDHIALDDQGIARVARGRSKVTQIVCDVRNGMSPEMIREAYPHLSLATATELSRVLFTRDEDLLREASARQAQFVPFAGVIYSHQNALSVGGCVDELELLAKVYKPADIFCRVVWIPMR